MNAYMFYLKRWQLEVAAAAEAEDSKALRANSEAPSLCGPRSQRNSEDSQCWPIHSQSQIETML